MTTDRSNSRAMGLVGPVALSGGLLLLLVSPLMRGGNRHVALIALELIGLVVLLALWTRLVITETNAERRLACHPLLWLLVFAPLALALIQLVPLPTNLWVRLPGRAVYADTLNTIGAPAAAWRALSVSPDATTASLLAALPLAAAFLLAYLALRSQLRVMLRLVVGMAFVQVALGLLQISGGQYSPLFFGLLTYGPPVGSFANRNHFANYIAMALAAYVWLGYEANRPAQAHPGRTLFSNRHQISVWIVGGLVLVLGILMSRSRGAAVFGLPMAIFCLGAVSLRINGWSGALRFAAPITLLLVIAAVSLIGFDAITSRVSGAQLASSANFRGVLARTSLEGAMAFWPWGSGWGTYDLAYQRFQPASIIGYANHAHQDYVEMLFEGGAVFLMLAAAFLWLAGRRAWLLAKTACNNHTLDKEYMAAALCGLGLLGLLLHSLVEFNLRIPANAILGALLAGVYLRPLDDKRRSH